MRGFAGQFTFYKKGSPLVVPNTVVKDGAELFLQTLFQAQAVLPASFWLGLTNVDYTYDDAVLSDIAAGEPVGNGYARQELVRGTGDWDVSEVNSLMRARSKIVEFTASANWDKAWNRMFLCSVETGTAGVIFAFSAKTEDDQTVVSGDGPALRYEFWNRI
jgi:hypothetical protein